MLRKSRILLACVSTISGIYQTKTTYSLYNNVQCDGTELTNSKKYPKNEYLADCQNPACASKLELFERSMNQFKKSQIEPNGSVSNEVKLRNKNENDTKNSSDSSSYYTEKDCPLDKDEVGRIAWALLHTIAASLPETTTELSDNDKLQLNMFVSSFAYLYPCHICAPDFQEFIVENPPNVNNRVEFSLWVCELHNHINSKLGRGTVSCNIDELDVRWKYGRPACWSATKSPLLVEEDVTEH